MGPTAVQNPAALVAALKSSAPSPNPKTPLERLNPDQQALEHVKAASVSLERAQQYTNDPMLLQVFNAIEGVLSKTLLKFDGAQVMQAMQESVQSFPPAQAAPGAAPLGVPPAQAAPPANPLGTAGAQAPGFGGPAQL